jgi:hypothetical protein
MFKTEAERLAVLDRIDAIALEQEADERQLASFSRQPVSPDSIAAVRVLIAKGDALGEERRGLERSLWLNRSRDIDASIQALNDWITQATSHFAKLETRPHDTNSVLEGEQQMAGSEAARASLQAILDRRALANRIYNESLSLINRVRRIPYERTETKAALKGIASELHSLKRAAGLAPSLLDLLAS